MPRRYPRNDVASRLLALVENRQDGVYILSVAVTAGLMLLAPSGFIYWWED